MKSTLRIAWRSLWRNWKRTALGLAAIGVAEFGVLGYDGFINGFADSMLATITGPLIGDAQLHHPDWRKNRGMDETLEIDSTFARVREVPGVEEVTARLYAPTLAAVGEDAKAAVVVGIDAEAESGRNGLLATLPPEGRPGKREVLLGKEMARRLGAKEGDEVAVIGQAADGSIANDLYRVKGILVTTVEIVRQSGVVMRLDDAQELFVLEGQAHEIVVHAAPGTDARALAARIAARVPEAEALAWQELAPVLGEMMGVVQYVGLFALSILFIAAAAGIANTLMMSVFERRHELGMLLALGCGPMRLVSMILFEAIALGLMGVAIGTAFGLALVGWFGTRGLDLASLSERGTMEIGFEGMAFSMLTFPRLAVADVAWSFAGVVITALLAASWPAIHAARMQPVEAMRS